MPKMRSCLLIGGSRHLTYMDIPVSMHTIQIPVKAPVSLADSSNMSQFLTTETYYLDLDIFSPHTICYVESTTTQEDMWHCEALARILREAEG